MIKYNDNNIIKTYYGDSGLTKLYYHDNVCYYKISGEEPTPPTPTGQTLQWVEFNNGDTIPSDLDIYGISGTPYDFYATFGSSSAMGVFIPSRNRIEITLYCNGNPCYSDNPYNTDNVELIFSNIGCCDYYNQGAIVSGGDLGVGVIKLYIYA